MIVAENVVRRHSTGRGVGAVSFSVRPGQCLGVLGPNSSGKTTLAYLIAGLDRPDSGRLLVLGAPAHRRPRRLRHRCGIALDTPAHWDGLSGRQNLWFFARQYGLDGLLLRRRVDGLLSETGLAAQADEPVAVYSLGMRRKLAVIEAMVHDPDLLILDEPSASADTDFLDWLARQSQGRCERGKATWIADNDADWLSKVTSDVVQLGNGHIGSGGSHDAR
jgi:ABC-2 type transport system ATP-binding protein